MSSDYITLDLVAPILKISSVKTILRCLSVCKSWKSLIDSKPFVLDHLSIQKPRLLAQNKSSKYVVIDPETLPLFETLTGPYLSKSSYILNSVHGVTCILGSPWHSDLVRRATMFLYLWNPSIHRHLKFRLPYQVAVSGHKYMHCTLWIDPSNNHTKIAISNFHLKRIALFSSTKPQHEAWTQIPMGTASTEDHCVVPQYVRQVLIHGVAYWTVHSQDLLVAYFDFVRDEFGTIDLPSQLATKLHTTINVCKWQDSLSLLHWQGNKCTLWTTRVCVHLVDKVIDVLFVGENRRRILAQTSCEGHLNFYDLKIKKKGIRLKSECIKTNRGFFVAYEFVESLVFPDL